MGSNRIAQGDQLCALWQIFKGEQNTSGRHCCSRASHHAGLQWPNPAFQLHLPPLLLPCGSNLLPLKLPALLPAPDSWYQKCSYHPPSPATSSESLPLLSLCPTCTNVRTVGLSLQACPCWNAGLARAGTASVSFSQLHAHRRAHVGAQYSFLERLNTCVKMDLLFGKGQVTRDQVFEAEWDNTQKSYAWVHAYL